MAPEMVSSDYTGGVDPVSFRDKDTIQAQTQYHGIPQSESRERSYIDPIYAQAMQDRVQRSLQMMASREETEKRLAERAEQERQAKLAAEAAALSAEERRRKEEEARLDPYREAQKKMLGIIQGRLEGKAPTVTELEAKKAREDALRAALSLKASQRGGNIGLGTYATQQQLGQTQQQIAAAAEANKLKELSGYQADITSMLAGETDISKMLEQQRQFQESLKAQYADMDLRKYLGEKAAEAAQKQADNQLWGSIIGAGAGLLGMGLFGKK